MNAPSSPAPGAGPATRARPGRRLAARAGAALRRPAGLLPPPGLSPLMGRLPRDRSEVRGRWLWIAIWLVFLADPFFDLLTGDHTGWALLGGWAGLLAFVGLYLVLVARNTTKPPATGRTLALLAGVFVLAVLLPLAFGESWLVLLVYFAVSCGAVLPLGQARIAVLVTAALGVVLPLESGARPDAGLVIPTLLGGFAMTGVRVLVRTTVELRQARATVAQLAANEERLRLARDLHDLLGHSLSLITLKSELAGRMIEVRPEAAAQQIREIEQVSRQSLADVREAVSGYRRPTLRDELAGAAVALRAAGITPEVPLDVPPRDGDEPLDGEREAALAWVLREAVTNVVRHSGAGRCLVALAPRHSLDGPYLELRVEDDGRGPGSAPHGNGLTGLAERLEQAGGTLESGPARPGGPRLGSRPAEGFLLTARVPLGQALRAAP